MPASGQGRVYLIERHLPSMVELDGLLAELKARDGAGMRRWRKRLFVASRRVAAEPGDYFRLTRERTITIGSEIEF